MRAEIQLHLFARFLNEVKRWLVRAQSDQYANFFSRLQGTGKLSEPADVEVSNKAIEGTSIASEQNLEPVRECAACFVGDESEVGGHQRLMAGEDCDDRGRGGG